MVADRAVVAWAGTEAGGGPTAGAAPASPVRDLVLLHTGIQGEYLPQELGFGSGMPCWRRLAAWSEAGVWDQLHLVLLKRLRVAKPAAVSARTRVRPALICTRVEQATAIR